MMKTKIKQHCHICGREIDECAICLSNPCKSTNAWCEHCVIEQADRPVSGIAPLVDWSKEGKRK